MKTHPLVRCILMTLLFPYLSPDLDQLTSPTNQLALSSGASVFSNINPIRKHAGGHVETTIMSWISHWTKKPAQQERARHHKSKGIRLHGGRRPQHLYIRTQ